MVVTEYYKTRSDGVVLNRTYSDANRYVMRDGVAYLEAIDPAEFGRTYTEGDVMQETTSMTETEEKAMAYDIITGVRE